MSRLPRRPELMSIESSDLQADGRREGVIVLNAVLRNQAPFAQEYPALELTLTDERDEAVARRVLLPRDYLAGAAQRTDRAGHRRRAPTPRCACLSTPAAARRRLPAVSLLSLTGKHPS